MKGRCRRSEGNWSTKLKRGISKEKAELRIIVKAKHTIGWYINYDITTIDGISKKKNKYIGNMHQ